MSTLNNFDVNELILQLHGELKFAFEVANSTGKQAGMQLDQLKVKFGKKNLLEASSNDEPVILNSERYPDEEDWELEVDYRYGDPIPDLQGAQNWSVGESTQLILDKLSDTSIEYIKGVSKVWCEKLNNAGIDTIKQLAILPEEKLQYLCRTYGSLRPLEFQAKVLLLVRNFKPLKYSQFNTMPLLILLTKPVPSLKKLFLNKLSGPEISDLKAMASVIYLCFDKKLTSNLNLGLLFSS